jgi:hypothetical protein
MKLRYLVLAGALAASAVGLMACGSSYSCSDKGSCANDVAPTQASIDACNKLLNGTCSSQAKALGQCGKDKSTCDSAGMSSAGTACDTEFTALTNCCAGNDGGACL